MEPRVELARQQWEESFRALSRSPSGIDPRVREQMGTVAGQLRRRVGSTFTLGELATAYDHSERWVMEAISEECPRPGWILTASSAADAAFHLYSRGAQDYRP
jgi:hypothetical protein